MLVLLGLLISAAPAALDRLTTFWRESTWSACCSYRHWRDTRPTQLVIVPTLWPARSGPPAVPAGRKDVTMSFWNLRGCDPDGAATGSGISRRSILRYGSGTALVAGVGLAGLLELLEHREAIPAGAVIPPVGVP